MSQDQEDRKKEKLLSLSEAQRIERSLITTYKHRLWRKFVKALIVYRLVGEHDRVLLPYEGDPSSFLLALLFKHLAKYSSVPFEVKYVIFDDEKDKDQQDALLSSFALLSLPYTLLREEGSQKALTGEKRLALLRKAGVELGYPKIVQKENYNDITAFTLDSLLREGELKTLLPKEHTGESKDSALIRPLYLIEEKDIRDFSAYNHLTFPKPQESGKRARELSATKDLIRALKKEYSPVTEKNIFEAPNKVNLDKVLGYKKEEKEHTFLDLYQEKGNELDEKIEKSGVEKNALRKASEEHRALTVDTSFASKEEKK